jgi:hypothetical protein
VNVDDIVLITGLASGELWSQSQGSKEAGATRAEFDFSPVNGSFIPLWGDGEVVYKLARLGEGLTDLVGDDLASSRVGVPGD